MIRNRKWMLQIMYVSYSWIMLRQYTYINGTKHPTDTNAMMYGCANSSISEQKVVALRGVKAADTAWLVYGNMEAGIIRIYNAHCTCNTAI